MIILGNLFSLLGSICSLISTRAKTYKKTLLIQSADAALFTLSCICLGGYSGVIVNLVAVARNLCCVFIESKRWLKLLFSAITIVLGLIFMDRAIYGLLPIIASAYYSIEMAITDDVARLKIALLINNLLWLIYEVIILDVVGIGFKVASIISILILLIKDKGTGDKNESN